MIVITSLLALLCINYVVCPVPLAGYSSAVAPMRPRREASHVYAARSKNYGNHEPKAPISEAKLKGNDEGFVKNTPGGPLKSKKSHDIRQSEYLDDYDALEIRGTGQEDVLPTKQPISVMSYNLKRWGDGRSDNVELLDVVRDIASKHDIICFQELFGDSVSSLKKGTFGAEYSVVSIEVDNLGEKLAVFYRADRFKPLVQFNADGYQTVYTSKSEPVRQKKTKRRSLHVFFEDLASNEQFLVSTAHVTPDAKEETIKELNYLEGLFSGAMKVWGFNMDNHGVPVKEAGKSKVFLFDMMMGISRLFSGAQKKNMALPNRNWKILEPFTVKKLAFALIAGDLNMDTPYVNADRRNLNFYKTVAEVPVYVKWFDRMKTNTGVEPKSYSNMISRADGSLFDCRVDDSVPDKVLREISDHYPIYCVVHSPGEDRQLLLTAIAKLFATPITQGKTRDEEEEGRKGGFLSEKRQKNVIVATDHGISSLGSIVKSSAFDSHYSNMKNGLKETAESSVRHMKEAASGAIVPYIPRGPYFLQ